MSYICCEAAGRARARQATHAAGRIFEPVGSYGGDGVFYTGLDGGWLSVEDGEKGRSAAPVAREAGGERKRRGVSSVE